MVETAQDEAKPVLPYDIDRHDGDFFHLLTNATPAEFAQLVDKAQLDAAKMKVWLSVVLPKVSSKTAGIKITSPTMERSEKVRKEIAAGHLMEHQAQPLFAIIAAAMVIEHRAAMLMEIQHMHETVLGFTKGNPGKVYDMVKFDEVFQGADKHYYGHGRRL
ncbi:MAG: hypothetical protein WCJ64_21960 [Rhodospirillaceae bacterium]